VLLLDSGNHARFVSNREKLGALSCGAKALEALPQPVSAIIAARISEETAGGFMSLAQRLEEVRTGFERPFWVANISEIFERLAYYGAFASLANYLREALNFPTEQTGTLTGIFGGAVWFLAIFGGAIADKLGFRRALSLAYAIPRELIFCWGPSARRGWRRCATRFRSACSWVSF